MSAQETVPGQAASSAALARATASKASPGRERLISAARSGVRSEESGETRTEASQPETKQSWKKSRSVPAAVDGLACCLAATTSETICSTGAAAAVVRRRQPGRRRRAGGCGGGEEREGEEQASEKRAHGEIERERGRGGGGWIWK
ncbi:hypothetical protein ZWY2020_025347 [Hordeum vulgare]|nr:hypothetical protein ZWY2020_025347 [Hordeum vulgare]